MNVSASDSQSGQEAADLADANRQLTERSEAVALLRTIAVATNEASSVEAVADGAAALELLSITAGKGDPFDVALVDMACRAWTDSR